MTPPSRNSPRPASRPPRRPRPDSGPPRNERIKAPQVRVIGEDGTQVGIMERKDALRLAGDRKLDLVQVAGEAQPPVCRLMNWSKHQYEQERKERKARRSKEKPPHQVRMKPNIAEHDYQTKRKHIEKFLLKGDKVRVSVMLRGRAGAHPEIGWRLIERFAADLAAVGELTHPIRHEGPQLVMLLHPAARTSDKPAEPMGENDEQA